MQISTITTKWIDGLEFMFSEECGVYVSRCGQVVSQLGRALRWKDNGSGVYVMNISCYGNQRLVTKHRLVYATWNNLEYRGEFKVGFLDGDYESCCLENLYAIGEKRKESGFDRASAFKLLELYHRGELFDSEGNKVEINKPIKRVIKEKKEVNDVWDEIQIRNGW